jgi:hypothetical protein
MVNNNLARFKENSIDEHSEDKNQDRCHAPEEQSFASMYHRERGWEIIAVSSKLTGKTKQATGYNGKRAVLSVNQLAQPIN